MIVDLKQGNIKVIMVKDLSRLGRDYIGVGDYIEQIFPLMGVRFIAVNNSFDSMKLNNGTPGIEVAVINLVNNMYSRDIAKKVRAALETNWKNGKATCTNVPFGYVWNKKGGQRWEIDPEAAASVKKVFELALSGRNTTQIAYGMNELNLPTPGLYAKRKNLMMGSNPIIAPDSEMLWNAAIVVGEDVRKNLIGKRLFILHHFFISFALIRSKLLSQEEKQDSYQSTTD